MKLLRRRAAVTQLGSNGKDDEREQRLIWRIAALLLDYPTADSVALLPQLRKAAPDGPLHEFLDYAAAKSQLDLAKEYVETFDQQRRSSLHLTYYAYGDTRKRGMALLRFKHAYRAAGQDFGDEELPDYLPALLEFAATVDFEGGGRLIGEHVPVLELLRLSLVDVDSAYHYVMQSVLDSLPPITTADRRRIRELAAAGPPEEDVGLDPFSIDPSIDQHGAHDHGPSFAADHHARQDLPMPSFGASSPGGCS